MMCQATKYLSSPQHPGKIELIKDPNTKELVHYSNIPPLQTLFQQHFSLPSIEYLGLQGRAGAGRDGDKAWDRVGMGQDVAGQGRGRKGQGRDAAGQGYGGDGWGQAGRGCGGRGWAGTWQDGGGGDVGQWWGQQQGQHGWWQGQWQAWWDSSRQDRDGGGDSSGDGAGTCGGDSNGDGRDNARDNGRDSGDSRDAGIAGMKIGSRGSGSVDGATGTACIQNKS